jgi:uncharacterized membrane protein (UPF0127 family)
MKTVNIMNTTRDSQDSLRASYHDHFWGKLRGLMFKKIFGPEDSLLIDQGMDSRINSAIHMLFMNFEIAAIWIDSNHVVVDATAAKPWKLAYVPSKPARYVLETHIHRLGQYLPGDQVKFHYE